MNKDENKIISKNKYMRSYNKRKSQQIYIKEYRKKYYELNKVSIGLKSKRWQEENSERRKLYMKDYYQMNKRKIMLLQHIKRKIPKYNLMHRMRESLRYALRLYTRQGKITSSSEYGINYKAIIEHLKPFPEDRHLYHVDHIRPLCSFNFINEDGTQNTEEIQKAFAPENHQWLLASKNCSKKGMWNKEIAEEYGVEYEPKHNWVKIV